MKSTLLGLVALFALGCAPKQEQAAGSEPASPPAAAKAPASGEGQGVAPMTMTPGGIAPVSGSESVEGAGSAGGQVMKDRARDLANKQSSSVPTAPSDEGN